MKAKTKMAFRLTKTGYLDYLKCPPEFWLKYHEPLLQAEEITLEHEHLRQQGYAVEQLVKERRQFHADEAKAVDFQRTFNTADYTARCDIVVTNNVTGTIEIYEIKASSSVKPEHLDDVAFQVHVAELAGARVTRAFVVTLNSDYVRQGDIDPEQLFVITEITAEVEMRRQVTDTQARDALRYLGTVPVPSLLEYCQENKLDCRFLRMHFPDLPDYTIFDITYLTHDKRMELLGAGIVDITHVPDDFPLSEKQRKQVAAAKSGEIVVELDKIRKRMDEWEYPLHFLDYETFSYAIPQFDGIRPFQQMCFQYSLHTIARPGADADHFEFLVRDDESNPPLALAKHLKEAFGESIGTVFVWYEAFEKTRNSEMAVMFPEYADFFNEVNEKTRDLMKVFADRLYIDNRFKGRSSIKKVLPVLCPDLDYNALGISEGLTASISWYRAVKWKTISDAERQRIFNDLEEYCELDTWAMVRIYEELCKLFECAPAS
jgi:hypothetical protein